MKKTTQKLLISTMALSLLTGGAVFADEAAIDANPVIVKPQTEADVQTQPELNGAVADGVSAETLNGVSMIPLRAVAEEFGYTVTWKEDDQSITLTKGAVYIRIAIGEDAYALSRRAAQPLGSAPVLKDDCTTYVPLNFVTEILGGYYSENEDGTYKIVDPSIVSVSAVNEDGSLTVLDSYRGEVIVHIAEDTVIEANGKAASVSDIKPDMVLGVEYAPAMTASIPPQTTAVKITLENLPIDAADEDAALTYAGKITEVDGNRITIGDPHSADSLCLIVGDDTRIYHARNKRIYKLDDLEVGMEISGTHSEVVTMSIPAQTVVKTIQIDSEAE